MPSSRVRESCHIRATPGEPSESFTATRGQMTAWKTDCVCAGQPAPVLTIFPSLAGIPKRRGIDAFVNKKLIHTKPADAWLQS
jgi:hypothetical protein